MLSSPNAVAAGKRILDGLPPLKQILTTSMGSIPQECEHKICERSLQSDFFLYEVPETVRLYPSRIWAEVNSGGMELKYATEADIVGFVKIFLRDIIVAMELNFTLVNDLSIKNIAPDICVVTDGHRLVGVIEVKKRCQDILIQPTVLGELFDQMLLLEGFYCSGPVIGILTTLEEWVFAWFAADHSHFTTVSDESQAGKSSFLTPAKAEGIPHYRYSPPGNTPSQRSGKIHTLEVAESEDEREEYLQSYDDRILHTTEVLNSQVEFHNVLRHLFTAFKRMNEVRLNHTVGVPRCLFRLHKGEEGITWHPISRIPIDVENLSAINVCSRNNVKHLVAVEDLGRGGSGKVWLTCTVSSRKPTICVLKFHNKNSTPILNQEKCSWDTVYPEFQSITSVDTWSGSTALKMPHFCSISSDEDRAFFKQRIEDMMRDRFHSHGLVHRDVRWRNIGVYERKKEGKNGGTERVPVLYDLESVRSFVETEDSGWIEKAMAQLYPE